MQVLGTGQGHHQTKLQRSRVNAEFTTEKQLGQDELSCREQATLMPLRLEHEDEVMSHACRRQRRKGAVHGLFGEASENLLAQVVQSHQDKLPCFDRRHWFCHVIAIRKQSSVSLTQREEEEGYLA